MKQLPSTYGRRRYRDHLNSDLFKSQKEKAWNRSGKKCVMCGKRFGLSPHHAFGYTRVGTEKEWLSLRFLCDTHHRQAHRFLWYRFPLKPSYLITRYYELRIHYLLKRLILFIYRNFGINKK